MAGSIFGRQFCISTWGESHGKGIGVVIDGCPAGLPLSEEDIQKYLDRRRPGQSQYTTSRNEGDKAEILSGVFEGKTTGTPISILVANTSQRSQDYSEIASYYRPGHADYTFDQKYGFRDYRGGGRSSGRETIGRVAAGAVARKFLGGGVKITAWVESGHSIAMPLQRETPSFEDVEKSPVRCPNPQVSARMEEFIKKARAEGDSVGGVIRCRIEGLPAGLGDPVFDRFEAELAKAMLSIPATKGFEIGGGFASARMFGSQNNDIFELSEDGGITTRTNNAGGVLGGITTSRPVDFRVAFKPTATIAKEQPTLTRGLEKTAVVGRGRHDPCVLPRAVPIVEAMAALVCADAILIQRTVRSRIL